MIEPIKPGVYINHDDDTVTMTREVYGELLQAKERIDMLDEMEGFGGFDTWITTS